MCLTSPFTESFTIASQSASSPVRFPGLRRFSITTMKSTSSNGGR